MTRAVWQGDKSIRGEGNVRILEEMMPKCLAWRIAFWLDNSVAGAITRERHPTRHPVVSVAVLARPVAMLFER